MGPLGSSPFAAGSSLETQIWVALHSKFSLRSKSVGVTVRAPFSARGRARTRCYGGQSRECIWYFDIPSPNTTIFGILWPPSIALWGSLVPPYTLFVR